MYYHEEQKDLFSVPKDYIIVHCISADAALGAGVAKEIEKRFHVRCHLKCIASRNGNGYLEVGKCYPTNRIFNLVTKKNYFEKPEWPDFVTALVSLSDAVEKRNIKKIAMPRIGCGLDKLKWDNVKAAIDSLFKFTDIEIMVCYL